MQFSTLVLAALASIASAQRTTVVQVARNGTLTFSPNNIRVNPGEFVQFQFLSGNHTVTQSNFDAPCQPISMHTNVTGFHSGFQPAAASAGMGMIPTYTVQINSTNPVWLYCVQGRHCENGMVMVINENTAANSSRSLDAYKQAAAQATTVGPADLGIGGSAGGGIGGSAGGGTGNGGSTGGIPGAGGAGGGNNGLGNGNGNGGSTTDSANGAIPTAGAGMLVAAPTMAGLVAAGVWALLL